MKNSVFEIIYKNMFSNKKAVAVLILCLAHPNAVLSRARSVLINARTAGLRYVYPYLRYPTIIKVPGPVTNSTATETSNASTNDIGTTSSAASNATSNSNLTISSTSSFGAGSSIGSASMGNINATFSPSNTATGASAQTTGAAGNTLANPTDSKNQSQ